jgi:zinc protease
VQLVLGALLAGAPPALGQQATVEGKPPVPIGPPPEVRLPEIQPFTLSNGLPVRLVELHALPVVQVELVVLSGAASEEPAQAGVADLTADMLDEGTQARDAIEIAEALEFLGARLSTGAGWDASSVGLHVATARLDSALTLMADVALHPAFPEKELERRRTERLTDFLLARDAPAALAAVTLAAALYPERHRYHARVGGTAETIAPLGREDLLRFYGERYVPSNAALIVVGDVRPADLRPRLEAVFGGWRGPPAAPRALAEAPQVPETRIVLVDRPGAEQSEIRVARVGPPRATADYVSLVVLNTLLGGPFSSRLNQNLRETHGYVYHAYSVFDFRGGPGPFVAFAPAVTAATDSAVVEFLRELRRIREQAPSLEELEKAKRYVALSFPAEFETTEDVASKLGELLVYGLPEDFWDTFVERVNAVTSEEVQAAAGRHLDPDASLIVVVGDASKVRAGLEGLGVGELELLTIEQVMGPPPRISGGNGGAAEPERLKRDAGG